MYLMRFERVTLENFRSYKKQKFVFGERSVIVADNGAGKTNLLEAIYLLSTGESERANEISEMIAWKSAIASIAGIVETGEERQELSVILTRGIYMGKVTPKRRYLVDGIARTKTKFIGKLPVALFRPEDMRLIEGSPPRRRRYLDESLGMAHPEYARALLIYEASLRRRNKLLDSIREGTARREQLAYWDQSVIKNGNIVSDYRRGFLDYMSRVKTSFGQFKLEYTASAISPERLLQYSEAEVAVGYTLVGPHKDDFVVFGKQKKQGKEQEENVMIYGSRGEQRLGVLFLKLAAMKYVEDKLGVKSLLLLDDIFSELDEEHRREVVLMMEGRQCIVTSAEPAVAKAMAGEGRVDIIRL
ncbi:MAG: replication and repair protein RecF protein [Microgenomates group bacterium GW2011_GWA2_46_7]|nr:MAG: replication and repair protein RecF protein [Microgenomates group bacterium GW2011_GWA2_46_7]